MSDNVLIIMHDKTTRNEWKVFFKKTRVHAWPKFHVGVPQSHMSILDVKAHIGLIDILHV